MLQEIILKPYTETYLVARPRCDEANVMTPLDKNGHRVISTKMIKGNKDILSEISF